RAGSNRSPPTRGSVLESSAGEDFLLGTDRRGAARWCGSRRASGGRQARSPTLWLALLFALLCLVVPMTSGAEEVAVPIPLQAELIVKVAEYDRNFVARAGDRVQVLLIAK